MWNSQLLYLPIIFVGILGVIGIFEDISILLGHEQWGESKIYLKYYAAILGTIGYAFIQYQRKK
jgi:hypothetical protein